LRKCLLSLKSFRKKNFRDRGDKHADTNRERHRSKEIGRQKDRDRATQKQRDRGTKEIKKI
jgi:hypothetical protein